MIIEKLPPAKNYLKIKRQQSCRIKKADKINNISSSKVLFKKVLKLGE